MIFAALITGLLALAWFADAGHDRSWTVHRYALSIMGIGAIVMGLERDWWAVGLWLLLCYNALRHPWPMKELPRFTSLLILYSLTLLPLPPHSPVLLLESLVAIGGITVALWHVGHHYTWQHNHTNMLLVTSAACAMALAVLQSWWWFLAVPVLCWPFLRRPGQAWLWMQAPALGLVAQWSLSSAAVLASIGAGCLLWLAYPMRLRGDAPDHGRLRIWSILLWCWWQGEPRWHTRLFGCGFGSWASFAESFHQMLKSKGAQLNMHNEFFVNPHNEYVHVLFEHGLVGLTLLMGYLLTLLYGAWMIQPALVIPALAVLAIALTCFPWTLPTEVAMPKADGTGIDYVPFGCMGMVIVTAVLVLVLGGGQ